MGTTRPDASKQIAALERRYRSRERWKRNAGVPTIRLATVAVKIQENAARSRRTRAQTALRRSTYTPSGTICGSAAALRDKMRRVKEKSPTDKLHRANFS